MPQFEPGFRLSVADVFVLIAGSVGTFMAGRLEWWYGFVIAFAVGHFFLFCNVFRISRPLELIWATIFTAMALATFTVHSPEWPITIAISLFITAVVIGIEMRSPGYHGIGWGRINPGLRAWWDEKAARSVTSDPGNVDTKRRN